MARVYDFGYEADSGFGTNAQAIGQGKSEVDALRDALRGKSLLVGHGISRQVQSIKSAQEKTISGKSYFEIVWTDDGGSIRESLIRRYGAKPA